ncbi:hypothetical protein FQZ97_1141550 [compost metagenome]
MQLRLILLLHPQGLLQGHFIGSRIDHREQIAGLYSLAFLERQLDQLAVHPATHIDRVVGGHRTQGLQLDRKTALRDSRHPHRHRPAIAPATARGCLGLGRPEPPDQDEQQR